MKKHHLIIGIVIVIAIALFYYFKKKKTATLRQIALSWANSDSNPTSKPIRVAAVNALPDSQLPILVNLIQNYFATNTPVTPELQKWWDAASLQYHIDGSK